MKMKDINFFQIEEFDDFLIELSPIEQILYIANNVIIF